MNPLNADILNAKVSIAVGALLIAGCGGSASTTPRRQVAAPPGIDLPSTDPTSSGGSGRAASSPSAKTLTSADENATAAPQNDVNGTAAAQGSVSSAPPAEKPARPEQITDWKPSDYLSAKQDRDPRLTEAVAYIGEKYASSANAARTILKLLVVQPPAQPPKNPDGKEGATTPPGFETARGVGGPQDPPDQQFVAACIDALVKNTTPSAREALSGLLKGQLMTPQSRDETAREILRALGTYLRPDHEPILFDLITNPQSYVAPPAGPASAAASEAPSEERYQAEGSQLTADWFQSEALRAAGARASDDLRTRLARFLDDPNVPQETANPLETYLASDNPRNLRAQILLYGNENTAEHVRADLENRLVAASSAALAELLGIPQDQQGSLAGGEGFASERYVSSSERDEPRGRPSVGGALRTGRPSRAAAEGDAARTAHARRILRTRAASRAAAEGDAARTGRFPSNASDGSPTGEDLSAVMDPRTRHFEVARALWTPETAAILESTLGSAASENANPSSSRPLLLAGTVPLDATRRLMHRMLVSGRDEGPQAWSSAGLLGNEVCDPALLVLVKDTYHSGAKSARRKVARARADAGGQGGSRGNGEGRYAGRDDDSSPTGDDNQWSEEVEQLVASLCQRCQASAERNPVVDDQAPAEGDADRESDPEVRLHKDAAVVAEFALQWPEQLPKELRGTPIAGLRLHYVRTEDEQRVKTLLTHYRRQARNAKEHENGEVIWLDRLEKNVTAGTQQSLDIRITGDDENASPNEPVPLVVEILTIQIPLLDAGQERQAKSNERTPG
jgi:hypothetical protein